jgi:glycopeptide antibiotics resistance protein
LTLDRRITEIPDDSGAVHALSTGARMVIAAGYTLLIIYGSLIPLEFDRRPLAEAWSEFLQIKYLQLGTENRADLMANFALFVPIGFLWTAALAASQGKLGRTLAGVVVLFASAALACGVEFVQVITPRTVSQNDIIAEIAGAAVGVLMWAASGPLWTALLARARSRSTQSLYSALLIYLAAYLAYCLAPFDFVVSRAELDAKINAFGDQWLSAGHGETGLRLAALIALEVIAAAPLGLLAAINLGNATSRSTALYALAVGASFGLAIETVQVFLVSGSSNGISIITRAVGALLGGCIPALVVNFNPNSARSYARPVLAVAVPSYLALAAALRGWRLATPWTLEEMAARLGETSFLPFYYHYYSPETVAMQSIVLNTALYLPVGMLARLAISPRAESPEGATDHKQPRFGSWLAAACGAAVGAVIETGRLAIGPHDFQLTNLLIAALAAALGYAILGRLKEWTAQLAAGPSIRDSGDVSRRDSGHDSNRGPVRADSSSRTNVNFSAIPPA